MSGANNILVDTNLIILAIGGNKEVRDLLENRTLFISVITEIELLTDVTRGRVSLRFSKAILISQVSFREPQTDSLHSLHNIT